MHIRLLGIVAILALGFHARPVAAAEPAAAATNTCTTFITTLPYQITAPGSYCLKANLVTSEPNPIQIQSSNVTLNCRYFSIDGTRMLGSNGIATMYELSDITIQNCVVRGFDRGILVSMHNRNVQILNNRVERSLSTGIQVAGHDARVVNNRVTATQGEPGQQVIGIHLAPFDPETSATGQELLNNYVAGLYDGGLSVGFWVSGATAPRIVNNHVVSNVPATGGLAGGFWLTGWAQGANTTDAQVINNTVTTDIPDVQDLWGQGAICRGNTSVGVAASGFAYCLSGSDNVQLP